MFKWISSFRRASGQSKWFIITAIVMLIFAVLLSCYPYFWMPFHRTGSSEISK